MPLLNPFLDALRILFLGDVMEGDLNAHLPYTITCGGEPMNKSGLLPSEASLVPIHRARWSGRLGWPGPKFDQEPASRARDSRDLLRLRSTSPNDGTTGRERLLAAGELTSVGRAERAAEFR